MTPLLWIILGGLAMSSIALVGGVTLVFREETIKKLLLPLVALSAGSLLGGALFHMLPEALEEMGNQLSVYLWLAAGFLLFFVIEQFLHWHHCHRTVSEHVQPLTYLVLIADGVHNFVGGLAVAGAFLIDVRVGLSAWVAAAAHEIPQELGDFGVLIHGGWSKKRALLFNVLSALTFLVGGLVAYGLSSKIDVTFLLPFAAGNFIYIAAVDLVPEINHHGKWHTNLLHFASFVAGLALLLGTKMYFHHH